MDRIFVAQPNMAGNERKYVLDCLDTNWISSIGKYIGQFEENFALFCGTKHAIATNNGTTALHLALVGLDLQPGDEVIIPTVTYIARFLSIAASPLNRPADKTPQRVSGHHQQCVVGDFDVAGQYLCAQG